MPFLLLVSLDAHAFGRPRPRPTPTPSPTSTPTCSPGVEVQPEADEYVLHFQAANGKFVVAECGGDDAGEVNANRDSAGSWETFYLKRLGGNQVSIRSIRGRFLSAENGGGSALTANRTALGGWEAFELSGQLSSGAKIGFRTHNGSNWVSARLDTPTARVDASAGGLGSWEEFTVHVVKTPVQVTKKRKGLVRKCGRGVCDDDGAFTALGASLFWGAWAYKNDRAKLERNLEFLRDNGFHYIRVLGTVGRLPWWSGRVVDWRDSDHEAVIAGLTDLAYDQYGLRVEWTLIGDGDQMIPNESDRFRLVDRFLAMSRGREHKIMHFEIANEAWQNGFAPGPGYDQLKRMTRYMNDRTDILVAASAPSGSEHGGDYCAEAGDFNGGAADLWSFHYDRSTNMVDGFWRHVRQPWESCNEFATNNEPMGPGSSVAKTNNPYHIVSAAIVTYVSRVAMYVWHTEAGVWGGTIRDLEGKSDLYENPSGTAFAAMNRLLPEGLADWSRQNTYNNPNHPFLIYAGGVADKIWPEGYPDGVVRAYGTVKGNDFVVAPIGIKSFARMEARRNLDVEVYDIVTGELLDVRSLDRGQSLTLNENGKGTYLLKGKFR